MTVCDYWAAGIDASVFFEIVFQEWVACGLDSFYDSKRPEYECGCGADCSYVSTVVPMIRYDFPEMPVRVHSGLAFACAGKNQPVNEFRVHVGFAHVGDDEVAGRSFYETVVGH